MGTNEVLFLTSEKEKKIRKTFGQQLQKIRKAHPKNITQDNLATMLARNEKSIKNWEQGVSIPKVYDIYLLCELFGCDFDYLCRGMECTTHNIQSIHEQIGLSESTIKNLMEINAQASAYQDYLDRFKALDPNEIDEIKEDEAATYFQAKEAAELLQAINFIFETHTGKRGKKRSNLGVLLQIYEYVKNQPSNIKSLRRHGASSKDNTQAPEDTLLFTEAIDFERANEKNPMISVEYEDNISAPFPMFEMLDRIALDKIIDTLKEIRDSK